MASVSSMTQAAAADKVRRDARRFVDGLAERLVELDRMAKKARRFNVFNPKEYAEFKSLFLGFTDLSEEFQMLSHLAEDSLASFERAGINHWAEHKELEEYFRRLQIPMLRQLISTNLRLLKVWDDRLQRGEGLPYGAREVFQETVRVIYNAKTQLLRPRYVALLDESALHDADRAERLLRMLIRKAPKLFNFTEGQELMLPAENDLDNGDTYQSILADDGKDDDEPPPATAFGLLD
ncbi:MAG TPA: hypothetical protein VK558_00820 [Patescibacteria group bacterium]|nr:hypothetical protein [Patescibacteria group bacterium]